MPELSGYFWENSWCGRAEGRSQFPALALFSGRMRGTVRAAPAADEGTARTPTTDAPARAPSGLSAEAAAPVTQLGVSPTWEPFRPHASLSLAGLWAAPPETPARPRGPSAPAPAAAAPARSGPAASAGPNSSLAAAAGGRMTPGRERAPGV